MAESEHNPRQEGERIVRAYLSKRGWSNLWRGNIARERYPGFSPEQFAEKNRDLDGIAEEAEALFSSEVENWRHNQSPEAREVLQTIVNLLDKRSDLGFYAKRIIARLKNELLS